MRRWLALNGCVKRKVLTWLVVRLSHLTCVTSCQLLSSCTKNVRSEKTSIAAAPPPLSTVLCTAASCSSSRNVTLTSMSENSFQ